MLNGLDFPDHDNNVGVITLCLDRSMHWRSWSADPAPGSPIASASARRCAAVNFLDFRG